MKKIVVPFLIFLLLFTLGCNNKIETPPENSMPFLTFSVNQRAGYVEAYLNYWDLAKGKILQTNKILYTITAPLFTYNTSGIISWNNPFENFTHPLSWDGESYIYLTSQFHKAKEIPTYFKLRMFDDPILDAKYASGKVIKDYDLFNYSQNLQIQTKNVGGSNYLKEKYGDFTFRVFDDGKIIDKSIEISLYNDVFNGGISSAEAYLYDKDKKEVKALYLYYDNEGVGHFLICAVNLEKGTYQWHEVTGLSGCIPNMNQNDISIIGNNFYVPLCGCYLGIINSADYTCRLFDQQEIFKSLSFYNAPIYCGGYPQIPGEYEEFLILNGTVECGKPKEDRTLSEDYKHLWIAFDTKTNKVVQILEWHSLEPQFIVVKDKNGKELSRMETDKLVKNISKVYSIDGESYIKGEFIDCNFIRFPHKNGA